MSAPPPVLTLAVVKGPREGETRQCRPGATLRVGRVVKGNDLAVRDTGASQQHLVIEFLPPLDARWTVSDLGSSNGTLLNGAALVPTVPTPLSHGDVIKVGDSTVLAVSVASGSDPTPRPTRSSRHTTAAAAVVPVLEEKPPLVTRRGTRKKAAALEPPVTEKEKQDTAEVVIKEKTQSVTRRGGQKKVAAAELSGELEEVVEATRRGVRKKAVKVPEPEKDVLEEATVMTRGSKRKKATEPPEQEKEEQDATLVTRRSRWKKHAELPEQEKEVDEAPVLAHRSEMMKDPVSVATLLLPPKTRSGRGQGRVTRGSAKNIVLEMDKEEQGRNGLAASRACTGNHLSGELEEAVEATTRRRGVRKKAMKVPEPEKDGLEEPTVMTHRSKRKKVVESPEQENKEQEAMVVTQRSRWKKPAELPEQEKEDDEPPVLANHGEMIKDPVSVAPLLLPPKTRPGRGQGRVTRGSAKNIVLQVDKEEQGRNELAASRACTGNHLTSTAVKGGKKKGKNVSAVDGEVKEIVKASREEMPKVRASAQGAASGKGASVTAAVPHEDTEEVAEVMLRGRRKKVIKLAEPEKEEKEECDVTVVPRRVGQKDTVTRCGRRKPDLAAIVPPAMPATTRSSRGHGRVTRAGQRSILLEENNMEEQEENEIDAPREQIRNLVNALVVNDDEEQKMNKVAARDREAEGTAKPLEEEVPKGRSNGQWVASANLASAAVVESPEEMNNAALATRRGGRKKTTVVAGRGRRKKDVATIAPPTLPAKTRSGRGQGRVTRASARNAVPKEDNKEENEVSELKEKGNPSSAMALNTGQEEKGHDVADGDGEAQGTASRADSGSNGIPNTTSKYREDRKLKAHSTPFDIRLDRALKKYSA